MMIFYVKCDSPLHGDAPRSPARRAARASVLGFVPVALLFVLCGVAGAQSSKPAPPLKIGVTLHPYYSWTASVVGNLPGYEVRALLPGDIDAGDYQPRPQDIKRLADLETELLEKISVAVVHRDDARNRRVGQLRRRLRFDPAQPPRILRRVLLQRRRVLRPQSREGALNRIRLLNRVRERDERMRVHACAAALANHRRLGVDAHNRRARVPRRLQHRKDEIVVADAIDDDDVEVCETLDVLRPRLVIPRVDIARQQRAHFVPRQVADNVRRPGVVRMQRDADLQRCRRLFSLRMSDVRNRQK